MTRYTNFDDILELIIDFICFNPGCSLFDNFFEDLFINSHFSVSSRPGSEYIWDLITLNIIKIENQVYGKAPNCPPIYYGTEDVLISAQLYPTYKTLWSRYIIKEGLLCHQGIQNSTEKESTVQLIIQNM